ncbi:hypothetical protein COX95_01700 [bacterium CG_4_10_14_0_2_um_filter_33_32]|nr:MAG: hypothetical protein AUJ93_01650 [bacterium CG2_30_33_46]PIU76482.1 MAG: hypothetical protein COS74_03845 [bacterium CG06_land_8_20_14_3_00_33_50]PIW81357.1 MAG: hypothetical protein COZ97_02230 [bacterium CG_4_8_14_3_um_filter_33_28]PIY85186.1 MAG: hypothetical protein COY76_03475 [bacterium CG_4_10_14_0_8_um_filter_33_57]PIZ86310.1 MAG: hypothetical protein COX95_01700 [bacterium CG_4_10_14_0_2_um_filter_33_32]PJA72286.1 MAG: hypothetical protein CO152_02245 [bacterium CG_4_9_14_3_um
MFCPNCKTQFKTVQANSANPGLFVLIDQCPNCGGIWFDQFELYQISSSEAQQIDNVNEVLLANKMPINSNLYCPKDHTKLEEFNDPNIPKDIQIDRCAKCSGIWLNKGELLRFKNRMKQSTKGIDSKIKSLIEAEFKGSSSMETLGRIGNFLMTPVISASPTSFMLQREENNPYNFSSEQISALKKTPQDKKLALYKAFTEGNKQAIIEDEKTERTVESMIIGLLTIIKIISRLLLYR